MPPRYAYWTIMAGGLPTAFRAVEREELLPTSNRLKDKHPDAEMKYFARGRLWSSPEEAKRDAEAARKRRELERRGGGRVVEEPPVHGPPARQPECEGQNGGAGRGATEPPATPAGRGGSGFGVGAHRPVTPRKGRSGPLLVNALERGGVPPGDTALEPATAVKIGGIAPGTRPPAAIAHRR